MPVEDRPEAAAVGATKGTWEEGRNLQEAASIADKQEEVAEGRPGTAEAALDDKLVLVATRVMARKSTAVEQEAAAG